MSVLSLNSDTVAVRQTAFPWASGPGAFCILDTTLASIATPPQQPPPNSPHTYTPPPTTSHGRMVSFPISRAGGRDDFRDATHWGGYVTSVPECWDSVCKHCDHVHSLTWSQLRVVPLSAHPWGKPLTLICSCPAWALGSNAGRTTHPTTQPIQEPASQEWL